MENSTLNCPVGSSSRSNSSTGEPLALNPFVGVPNPDYTGWYVEGSWFFGGHKTYDKEEARWGRPKVDNPMLWNEKSGWGALQLVGKYDVIDLSDTGNQIVNSQTPANTNSTFRRRLLDLSPFPGIGAITGGTPAGTNVNPARVAQCGEMKTWIIGANWYLNDYVRLMFNYAESDLGDFPLTPGQAGTNRIEDFFGFDGAKIRGFGMRAQVDW